jgi:hypothetical protein
VKPSNTQIELAFRAGWTEGYSGHHNLSKSVEGCDCYAKTRLAKAERMLEAVLSDIEAQLEALEHDEFCHAHVRSLGHTCNCPIRDALRIVRGELG